MSQINSHGIGRVVRYVCCDCGLAHDVVVKRDVQNPDIVMLRWWRENRSTGQFRRNRDYACKPAQNMEREDE